MCSGSVKVHAKSTLFEPHSVPHFMLFRIHSSGKEGYHYAPTIGKFFVLFLCHLIKTYFKRIQSRISAPLWWQRLKDSPEEVQQILLKRKNTLLLWITLRVRQSPLQILGHLYWRVDWNAKYKLLCSYYSFKKAWAKFNANWIESD